MVMWDCPGQITHYTLSIHYIYTLCTHYLHTICTLSAHYLHSAHRTLCSVDGGWELYGNGGLSWVDNTLSTHYLHTIYTLSIHYLRTIYTIYTLYTHYLHSIHTLSTHYLHTICTQYTHYIHTGPNVACLELQGNVELSCPNQGITKSSISPENIYLHQTK